jgi:flagellar motility protein MotE (MotC chaperone)
MSLDYITLDLLRQNHPAWRLLRSDHAPLAASFLHRVFIAPNTRVMAQADLAEALEDELFGLRQRLGPDAFPKPALDYLNDWAANERGWLRKFYRTGSDEPQFDLTPATEKAIAWLATLTERAFIGTESRLLTLFELLKQMSEGSETDPQARIAELQKRRDEIDAEMEQVVAGDIPLLDGTALKDRFQQFMGMARELLTDFREVEHNFRGLDRRVRERIALWEGSKGELLEEIMGERDAIADSDQGRSFRAFWDFLMSSRRQEELTALLERVLALPPVAELNPDALALIGKRREAERFKGLAVQTGARQPLLLPWLKKRPLRALELAGDWPRLLDIVTWLQANPRPSIYLRQVDIPGVHSKFIEAHRATLSELLDLALPAAAIDASAGGVSEFARRYGFRDKPLRIRFRLLDPRHALIATGTDQDFAVTRNIFDRLDPDASQVFITENEINFLAFPPITDSLVIFGAGYGFDMLADAAWLHNRTIFYWGDIDTHGFAILDQLRALFPHVRSFLMDRETLSAHHQQWIAEPQPTLRDLPRLNDDERALFDDLRDNRLGTQVRLEQEKIAFGWIEETLIQLQRRI